MNMMQKSTGYLEREQEECDEENTSFLSAGSIDDEEEDEVTRRAPSSQSTTEDRNRRCKIGSLLLSAFGCALLSSSVIASSNSQVVFECPARPAELSGNLLADKENEYHSETESFSNDMKEFERTFRTRIFDAWSYTYNELKEAKRDMVQEWFAPYLKSGDKIFESAIGMGLTTYMTLELLAENSNIDNIQVYGNEYVDVSTQKANAVYSEIPPYNAQKGSICSGDSTNLSFVPSDSFDLVFTGYVTPLQDPLNLGDKTEMVLFGEYKKLCDEKDNDWKSGLLNQIAQERGNAWYAQWVSEMIRIAKPGAPIIIEQVQLPFCKPPKKSYPGEGGVSMSWWLESVNSLKEFQDIDPMSLQLQEDPMAKENNGRYNVFMRKRK